MILFDYLPSCNMYANIFNWFWIVMQKWNSFANCYEFQVGCDEIESVDGKVRWG